MKLRWLLLALTACCATTLLAQNSAKPFLWRIEGPKPSYVFGTIHLGDGKVVAALERILPLVDSCEAVYTEIPMDKGTQLRAAMELMGKGSLSEKLPKDLYERAGAALKRINPMLSLAPFETMEIWALAVSLPLLEEQFKNPGQQAMDAIIFERAEGRSGKTAAGLETLEEQLGVFRVFSTAEQIEMLRSTLDDLEETRKLRRDPIQELRQAYLSGSLEQLDKKMNEWTGSLAAPLRDRVLDALLAQRNARMARTMQKLLKEAPGKSHFFAVGAGHLGGDKGLLAELQKAGYKLTRIAP
ncbi:MAG: TraB/GumN family protein [Verrucomicrobia bacterium]|nr:TraB/GumN family protein [Verrucomicrobiota bacterium]